MKRESARFRTVLVPLDGSPLAEQAVPLAARIAEGTGAKLRLAKVHTIPPAPLDLATARMFVSLELAVRRSERAYLRAIQARLRAGGTRLSSAVMLSGKPGPALAEYVREMGIDLVVMGTHGRGGLRRAWVGSVADYLVRHLQAPVLLVRPDDEGAPRPELFGAGRVVLVPLDGSSLAEQAMAPAAALARIGDAELMLLQVVPPVLDVADPTMALSLTYDDALTAQWRQQAEDYLSDLAERLRADGIRASGVAVVGHHAADTILELASREQVALIALSTRGRGGLQRALLGSVADKLVRGAEVPVLVCPPAPRAPKERGRAAGKGRTKASGRSGR
jgi:nucleotide-binding universal stress UspA family protein